MATLGSCPQGACCLVRDTVVTLCVYLNRPQQVFSRRGTDRKAEVNCGDAVDDQRLPEEGGI